ncbi:class I SAM-dependent methyltransferase [Candidatus Woesearchaeota archaeon]|nr:class I SAM-dependent methyltransferase [Candidatus Woesearchaeota archaeon]
MQDQETEGMDEYTRQTKEWLDERFRRTTEEGVYYAHQPIYGLLLGHSEPYLFERYVRTYQIMKTLSQIEFSSLLDVGGAEGYKAFMAKRLIGVQAENSDLSEEACKRAEEVFSIRSTPADIHSLPFKNDKFDVVLCSETLEHVTDWHKAVDELLRVARKAVVITVPCESQEIIDQNFKEKTPHGHIHRFDQDSLGFLESQGLQVTAKRIVDSSLNDRVNSLELTLREACETKEHQNIHARIRSLALVALGNLAGKIIMSHMVSKDEKESQQGKRYNAILFTVLKDKSCIMARQSCKVSGSKIVNLAVPFHYLKKSF